MTCQVTRFDPFRFLCMGYVKDVLYQMMVQDVCELHCHTSAGCETVTPVMLKNTGQEVEYHLEIC
jgi:hypothetical protein